MAEIGEWRIQTTNAALDAPKLDSIRFRLAYGALESVLWESPKIGKLLINFNEIDGKWRRAAALYREALQELEELVRYIRNARAEISAIRPDSIRDEEIPMANDELDAIVSATEEATGVFLDVAEHLEKMADNLGGDDGEKLYELTTRIYEASNFQDVTGQRITKVVGALGYIEAKVERLSRIIDGQYVADEDAIAMEELMPADDRPDADLMHGPDLPADANSQDDIDALMASFD